jgi:type VI protein secretion system component Hcp
MKKSRQTKRSTRGAAKDLRLSATRNKATKDVKGGNKVHTSEITITKYLDKASPS